MIVCFIHIFVITNHCFFFVRCNSGSNITPWLCDYFPVWRTNLLLDATHFQLIVWEGQPFLWAKFFHPSFPQICWCMEGTIKPSCVFNKWFTRSTSTCSSTVFLDVCFFQGDMLKFQSKWEVLQKKSQVRVLKYDDEFARQRRSILIFQLRAGKKKDLMLRFRSCAWSFWYEFWELYLLIRVTMISWSLMNAHQNI